jgi:hypothetical protein
MDGASRPLSPLPGRRFDFLAVDDDLAHAPFAL